jgi:uncharacterized membrane protein
MKLKGIGLIIGIVGIILIFSSLTKATITGAVVGVNPTSKFLGFLGILLMIIAIVIERYEMKKHLKK